MSRRLVESEPDTNTLVVKVLVMGWQNGSSPNGFQLHFSELLNVYERGDLYLGFTAHSLWGNLARLNVQVWRLNRE